MLVPERLGFLLQGAIAVPSKAQFQEPGLLPPIWVEVPQCLVPIPHQELVICGSLYVGEISNPFVGPSHCSIIKKFKAFFFVTWWVWQSQNLRVSLGCCEEGRQVAPPF